MLAISKAVLGQGAKFWWWHDCVCPVWLNLQTVQAVVPRIVKNSLHDCGKEHIITELWVYF